MRSFVVFATLLVGGVLAHGGKHSHHIDRVGIKQRHKLRYSIEHNNDGTEINHPKTPAVVELSVTCNGDMRVDVTAPFYNSPHPEEHRVNLKCPNWHYRTIWDYEVVEVFFVNDKNEYFDVRFSPRGRYYGVMNKGQRESALYAVPEKNIPVEVHNPCLDDHTDAIEGCDKMWSSSAVIPREYLPPSVTKFNAHFMHGNTLGEESPAEENKSFESLYPRSASIDKPDNHDLASFKKVNLTVLGFMGTYHYSGIWKHALGKYDKTFWYDIAHDSQCNFKATSEDYTAHVDLTRDTETKLLSVSVVVKDKDSFMNIIGDEEHGQNPTLSKEKESFWVNFRNEHGEYLRVGINPNGAYKIKKRCEDGEVKEDVSLEGEVECEQLRGPDYKCEFKIPYDILPRYTDEYRLQILHFHHVKCEDGEEKSFTGALCPYEGDENEIEGAGEEEPREYCWKGCPVDKRFFACSDKEEEEMDEMKTKEE